MNETQALDMLAALSQQMRLGILRYLISRGDAGAPAGEIAHEMGAIASKASFHLAALERAGLVSAERKARQIIYRVRYEKMGALISFLLNDCCKGHPDIRKCCGLP